MKKRVVIGLVFLQIIFITAHIYKQTVLVALTYQQQKEEREHDALVQEKNNLLKQLYTLQDPQKIKEFALKRGMKKMALHTIQKIVV